jgi:hypothetical protein
MFRGKSVAVIIPALNEAEVVGDVVRGIDRGLADRVIVVDNGSTDGTRGIAARAGAEVVVEARRGYGAACARGVEEAGADIYVFVNGDGSDDTGELERLLSRMDEAGAAMAMGSRASWRAEPGALSPVQRLGNALTCALMGLFWGARYTDLGPFRAVTRGALERMGMEDRRDAGEGGPDGAAGGGGAGHLQAPARRAPQDQRQRPRHPQGRLGHPRVRRAGAVEGRVIAGARRPSPYRPIRSRASASTWSVSASGSWA